MINNGPKIASMVVIYVFMEYKNNTGKTANNVGFNHAILRS